MIAYIFLCMHTVVALPEYLRQAERLLSEQARTDLVDYLAAHPKAGVIIRGAGGIRKLRWARAGMGKSGGVRVIYYYHDKHWQRDERQPDASGTKRVTALGSYTACDTETAP